MGTSVRLVCTDCFSGFAVMAMVLASHLFTVDARPQWLRHAPNGTLTLPDLGAPLLSFAIGLTYGFSVRRMWARDGQRRATMQPFLLAGTLTPDRARHRTARLDRFL